MEVEKATIKDAPQIHKQVNYFAGKGEMLPRALSEIYENTRDYFVVREEDRVVACAALHIYWSDLAELRAVTVSEDRQKQGIGARLVQSCIGEAKELGIPKIFCLTYKPAFFGKFGFKQVDNAELPRKVWAECYTCPKFPNCDEVALIYQFEENNGSAQ